MVMKAWQVGSTESDSQQIGGIVNGTSNNPTLSRKNTAVSDSSDAPEIAAKKVTILDFIF